MFMRATALTLTAQNALALRCVVLVPIVVLGPVITRGWHTARAAVAAMREPTNAMLEAAMPDLGLLRPARLV
ncbi:MAG: hypothetical protein ABL931_13300 [Usitatibacteraceae bacterium]